MREPETSCERSDRFGEEVHRVRLPSGLTLWFLPRPGFTRKTAVLAARFGSVHDAFEPADGGPIVRVPAGTAHFLEHRLFETDRGDAFDLFERLGASANAGTGHTNTTYFFSCTDSFYPALEILLSFVDGFRIDDAMVERERRIIVQEILSYADSPDWRGFLGLLGALYPSHPVRLDISGTVASVKAIDAAVLRTCFDAFYCPANVDLVVSGDLEAGELIEAVTRIQGGWGESRRPRVAGNDDDGPVVHRQVRRFLPVPRPRVFLGFRERDRGLSGEALYRGNLAANVALSALFGKSSNFYRRHYRTGLIDETFSVSFRGEEGFTYTALSAETEQPQALRDAVFETLERAKRDGLDGEDVTRAKRRMKGRFFKTFNSPEASAFSLVVYALRGVSLFSFEPVLDAIALDDVNQRLVEHFDASLSASCVIENHLGSLHRSQPPS